MKSPERGVESAQKAGRMVKFFVPVLLFALQKRKDQVNHFGRVVPILNVHCGELFVGKAGDRAYGGDGGEPFVFVGQEKDGSLLFTWEDSSPSSEGTGNEELVTYIGVYNPYKKAIRAVFVHEQKSTIVNATINQGHTFIGFVTHEYVEQTGPQGKLLKQGVYRAFIAEIEPQNRVFYLNLEREAFIKLQFLYGYYRQQSTASTREDHLLVCLHRESVGVYHLPLARVGEQGVIMSGEPKKEQLFHRRFAWMQWDGATQRLYLLHFIKSGKNQRGQTQYQPYLKCYQLSQQEVSGGGGAGEGGGFYRKEKQLVLDMALDLPIPYIKDSVASNYLPIGPHQVIPDAAINLQVLSQPSGAFCVCYQHYTKPTSDSAGSSDITTLQYSVCVVHKERMLHCQTYNIPSHILTQARLFFSWIDGYLLVHLPGQLTHLLCVGAEYDLGMHVFCQHKPDSADTGNSLPTTLIPYPIPEKGGGLYSTGMCYFDLSLGEAFHCTVSESDVVRLFETCNYLYTKVAILHYAVVQTRNLGLTKKLCESMCADPTELDNVCLLQEILLGHTYSQLRIQVFAIDKKLLHYLPYTDNMCFSFNTHVSQDCGGHICSLTYTPLPEITLMRDKRDREKEPSDFWHLLAGHMTKGPATNRFQLPLSELDTEVAPHPPVLSPTQETPSIFQKLTAAAKSAFSRDSGTPTSSTAAVAKSPSNLARPVSRVDSVLGRPPSFLGKDEESYMRSSRYFSKTLEHLSVHLIDNNKLESRTKIRNVAEEYVKSQMISSRLLCHMVWSVLMKGREEDGQLGSGWGLPKEAGLCLMMDRYYMAVKQLGFPLPSGFPLYHTMLGLRSHPTQTFLEFVDQGVYSVTPEFVMQLLHDTDGDESLKDLKWLLVSRLNQNEALQCLRHWRHLSAMQCVSQHYSDSIVTKQAGWEMVNKGRARNRTAPVWSQEELGGEMFPPAITFIKYLQKKDHGLHSGGSSGGLELDTEYLKQAAMVYLSVPEVPH